jgi:hypothetical protein
VKEIQHETATASSLLGVDEEKNRCRLGGDRPTDRGIAGLAECLEL